MLERCSPGTLESQQLDACCSSRQSSAAAVEHTDADHPGTDHDADSADGRSGGVYA
jgi:hypothetical protein